MEPERGNDVGNSPQAVEKHLLADRLRKEQLWQQADGRFVLRSITIRGKRCALQFYLQFSSGMFSILKRRGLVTQRHSRDTAMVNLWPCSKDGISAQPHWTSGEHLSGRTSVRLGFLLRLLVLHRWSYD